MADVEDTSLIDLALGLLDDPELREAVHSSHELRKRFKKVEKDLRHLDGELHHLESQASAGPRGLRPGPWRILLAVDDSQPSQRAVEVAAVLAEMCDSEILVFHAREAAPNAYQSFETLEAARELVAGVVARLRLDGLRADGETHTTRSGHTARDIALVADSAGADLIVLGSRGASDLAALLVGSVAHQTIRRANCPVLVVR